MAKINKQTAMERIRGITKKVDKPVKRTYYRRTVQRRVPTPPQMVYGAENKFQRRLMNKQAITDFNEKQRQKHVMPQGYISQLDKIRQLEVERKRQDAIRHDLMQTKMFDENVQINLIDAGKELVGNSLPLTGSFNALSITTNKEKRRKK